MLSYSASITKQITRKFLVLRITDKLTQEFYGSTFVEMRDPTSAIAAVKMDKQKLMGRPLKIYYCPPRPGDVWPPEFGDRFLSKPGSFRPPLPSASGRSAALVGVRGF